MIYKLDNIEITDTQLDELIAQRELNKFEYPLYKRWSYNGKIIKFTSLKHGEVVVAGKNSVYNIGDKSAFGPHTDGKWEDVPYNKERDLFHTQAIECWDIDNTHHRTLRFYDAINDRTFTYSGKLNGAVYNNYEAVPLDKVPDWMNKARATLEK